MAAHASFQWSGIANAVLVIWDEDLAFDTEYEVELTPGLRTMDGRPLPAPVSLRFRTRCAPEALADCVVASMAREEFLILPHPGVRDYMLRKASDVDRWLAGMNRWRQQAGPAGR